MSYAIEHDEPVPEAIARIMDEQLVRAREQLTDPKASPDKRVHDARKRFKETRALIRLVREPLGAQFRIENAWFRDAGRDLAAARDADAMLEALDQLELPRAVRTKMRRTLAKQRQHPPLDGLIANALDQLVVARARVALWPRLDDSFDTLAAGLRRTYRDGRRAFRTARTADELHEWRKHAKTHWYHVQLLRKAWPAMFEPYADVMQSLSRALGDHHDLHVLGETVPDAPPELAQAISGRQQKLEREARAIGARVYAERPEAWLARMRNLWKAWR